MMQAQESSSVQESSRLFNQKEALLDENLMAEIPVIDMACFLEKEAGKWEEECRKVAQSLHKHGILIVRDPRASEEDNENYLDLMERYFDTVSKNFYAGEELADARPSFNYQRGVTPEKIERARNHYSKVKDLPLGDQPFSQFPPIPDAKWRYFWKIGERAAGDKEDFPQVLPEDKELCHGWEEKMNTWGQTLLQAANTAAEMAAIGMGLNQDTFTKNLKQGAHLLAPTGSDLKRWDIGTALASFHYDIGFLTVHGKSRFPGLYIWLRNWKKVLVRVPKGCLLMQAGTYFENITGGYVLAGYHEVVYSNATKQARLAAEEEIRNGKERRLWRVSSTLFSHFRLDTDISPMKELSHLYTEEEASKYKKMTAYENLMEELNAISLAKGAQ